MLDTDTKRRIDAARDILVGKLPDPKSQVEQITIALIYKFMDDMDAQSEEFGGERTFFSGEFLKYGWARLMRGDLGGHEKLGLYSEAITRMPENPGIPPLFRDIFKNAFLPYRDPETLRAFLKVIDDFEYDHSERLGDAFEYLLSVLGSQGDAGQFRTPRHIIDFIVSIVDPKKDETVLDPACGTAGFLISSYKHILKANNDEHGDSTLTPDERERLAANFRGYDISPDMVRLSLVNMYLHGFADPQIHEYDTLTSLDRWNEHADVILANPPFMSPKGGIRPHKRFSVQSNRSEVLFVDYMAEHLTPNGRAGIIVPEGIIFQSQIAYRQLRKVLVEQYLVAVVSLPAGVFNPYSGVKTSILILDKAIARQTAAIGFFKVEHDGFDLGSQRRPGHTNDLPQARAEIGEYLRLSRSSRSMEDFRPALGSVVAKGKIAASGDYSLSGERYRESQGRASAFPVVAVGRFVKEKGRTVDPRSTPDEEFELLSIPAYDAGSPEVVRGRDVGSPKKLVEPGDVLLSRLIPHIRRAWVVPRSGGRRRQIASTEWIVFAGEEIDPHYLRNVLVSDPFHEQFMRTITGIGGSLARANKNAVSEISIPLPPLLVQRELAVEIEAHRKVIDGARIVIDNYRTRMAVDSRWPTVRLDAVCHINPDTVSPQSEYPGAVIHYIDISSVENRTGRLLGHTEVKSSEAPARARRRVRSGDVLLSTVRPNLRAFTLLGPVSERTVVSTGFAVLRARPELIDPTFVLAAVGDDSAVAQMTSMMGRGSYPSINQADVGSITIPLPPLAEQQRFVAEITAEQELVDANRMLVERIEKKIRSALARLWGDEVADPARPTEGLA